MSRILIVCVIASVLSSTATVWLLQPAMSPYAAAQDRSGPRGPLFAPGDESNLSDAPIASELPRQQPFLENDMSPEEAVNVAVYEAVNRSVVNITSRSARADRFFLLEVPTEGNGSGSVLDRQGHILTNYHVVEGAREVAVTLYNGESFDATFVGADPINDVAVLKIDAPAELLYPVELGDSRRLKVGMRVFALGNPFGLERTLTTGIISSLNRSLQIHGNRTIKSIIQIDASINPGNSGGPLLDTHGRLIGINTAIASSTGQSAGVGFAIPVSLINRVVPQLIKYGRVIRPEIGILKVYETEEGLLIAQLRANGPAEAAGLRGPQINRTRRGPFVVEKVDRSAADLIIGVDDQQVQTADDFLNYIESKRPGQKVVITIIRDGRTMQVPITLEGDPQDAGPAP